MATSHAIFKTQITDYLKRKFPRNAKILDVGAGEGTYLPFLRDYFTNIEAVEIFEPYIKKYDLKNRYEKVYNVNILDFKYDYYDIIIFGDVIEHLEVPEAQKVLEYAFNRCKEMVVAVPYLNPQGIEENNIYEIHKQDDLTDEIMKKRYPYLENVYKDKIYGYYIKEARRMKNYKVKALFDFNDTEEKNEYGGDTPRKGGKSIWNCTKERYEYLLSKRAVVLVGIDEIEDEKPEEKKEKAKEVPNKKTKTKKSK